MSGDYIEYLETIIENQETIILNTETIATANGYLIAFLAVVVIFSLLRYIYRFLDIFF